MTSKEYYELITKHPKLRDKGDGAYPKPKEWKGMERQISHVQPKSTEVEKASSGKFSVTISFFCSDRRARDLDNGASTILDCLITARRQLLCDYGITSKNEESS